MYKVWYNAVNRYLSAVFMMSFIWQVSAALPTLLSVSSFDVAMRDVLL